MPAAVLVTLILPALGLIVMTVYVVRIKHTQSRIEEQAKAWPTTEATIQQYSTVIISRYSGELPCFYFSYVIGGEYYSGSFALSVYGDRADTLRKEMINRKLVVCYDPNQPSKSYIPEDTIEGYEVKRIYE